jgi:hypothetical protein
VRTVLYEIEAMLIREATDLVHVRWTTPEMGYSQGLCPWSERTTKVRDVDVAVWTAVDKLGRNSQDDGRADRCRKGEDRAHYLVPGS